MNKIKNKIKYYVKLKQTKHLIKNTKVINLII